MRGWVKNKTYYKFEDETQKLRLCEGSWSVNLDELEDKDIEKIVYRTKLCSYEIEFEVAKRKGFIRTFKGETKLIVPLHFWNIKEKK